MGQFRRMERVLAFARYGRTWCCIAILANSLVFISISSAADPAAAVDFSRQIRPILSDTCFKCHGPDSAARQAELRLDQLETVFAKREGAQLIVPGKPDESELYRRISTSDHDERMPPADSGRTLNSSQIELIRRWIEEGAKWQTHWAFQKPQRPVFPEIRNTVWVRNGIDRFILARLEREGLTPAPEANKETWLRRVSLDLTGLPPTIAEIDAFLADSSPTAYETVVDRLLASPHFGERMAMDWLDAARYADTNGYQTDAERFMWRWRDWVIEAYNRNLPFDQFTIEQLAGDMLPNATLDQVIATGFNRNHRGNGEGGIIPEEFAVEYVVDRVDTTFTAWLGLTMGCARCHDHKFDPFSQKEFYQAFAYFNNVPERGKAFKYGNSAPFVKAPTRAQQSELAALEGNLKAAQQHFASLAAQVGSAQAEWENAFAGKDVQSWTFTDFLIGHYPFDGNPGSILPDAPTVEVQGGEIAFTDGVVNTATEFDGHQSVIAGDVAELTFYDKFTFAAWIKPRGDRGGTILSRLVDQPEERGYSIVLDNGKLQVNLIQRWLDDSLRVETQAAVPSDQWSHVAVTYDGSRVADGTRLYINGEPQPVKVNLDELNQDIKTDGPLRIGSGLSEASRFVGAIDDVRVYGDCLTEQELQLVATPESIAQILAISPEQRTDRQQQKLRACFLSTHAPESLRNAYAEFVALQRNRVKLLDSLPTTMVMQESSTPRDTFVLTRGEYDKLGEKVSSSTPAILPPLPAGAPNNRLGFANWVASESNPLTARVAVNRYWQSLFGTGLVKTVEDFGSQGEPPVHAELLDWLAVEFMSPSPSPDGSGSATKWDVKALLKLIVTSATYRQSSQATPKLLQIDPDNRLLARGPRVRLTAETIRDQALAVSGLLVRKVGGPSVKPYQPAGLWEELASTPYEQDHGENLFRRSLYTFWKRTAGPPTMMTFDASARETCVVRETRTNTPLQALTLMNDVTFVEAARVFAERAFTECSSDPAERIQFLFRTVTGREARLAELPILLASLQRQLDEYRQDPAAAKSFLSAGEHPRNEALDASELAAYATVAGLILNLDEAVTKE